MESQGTDLYEAYCQFVQESGNAIASQWSCAASRAQFLAANSPLPRREFERLFLAMPHGTQLAFARRMRCGFDVAVVTESRNVVGLVMRNLLLNGGEAEGVEE